MNGEETWELIIGDNEITDETIETFSSHLMYSAILLIATSAVGYIGFRKKEFK